MRFKRRFQHSHLCVCFAACLSRLVGPTKPFKGVPKHQTQFKAFNRWDFSGLELGLPRFCVVEVKRL